MSCTHLPYRPCAGVCLINASGLIFAGQRIDNPTDAWQMPQGGIDSGESAADAGLRELEEETGVKPSLAEPLGQSEDWMNYDLPEELLGKLWGGQYRGQRQKWFAYRFLGQDQDVQINQKHPEFSQWRWVAKEELIEKIVPFKRDIYRKVLDEFSHWLA